MNRARFAVFVLCALASGGCIAASLQPLVDDPKDAVTEDRLLGTWSTPLTTWTVRRSGDASYRVIRDEGELRSAYEFQLTRLGNQLYMDLSPNPPADTWSRYEHHLIAAHTLARVSFAGDSLRLRFLAHVEPDSAQRATGDSITYSPADMNGERNVITASTDEVRRFLTRHAGEAWRFTEHTLIRDR